MTDEAAIQFFYDALGVVKAYNETPSRIFVSYRVWEALKLAKVLDSQDAWRPGVITYLGTPVAVREDFAEGRVDVSTKEEAHILALMDELRNRALRDTGVNPVAYELGTEKYELFQRACRSATVSYQGIPVKRVADRVPTWVGIQLFSAPPEWCKHGSCIARKDNDAVWGKVISFRKTDFHVIVRDLEREIDFAVSYADIRADWQLIPDRAVPDSRFARILGGGSVSSTLD